MTYTKILGYQHCEHKWSPLILINEGTKLY